MNRELKLTAYTTVNFLLTMFFSCSVLATGGGQPSAAPGASNATSPFSPVLNYERTPEEKCANVIQTAMGGYKKIAEACKAGSFSMGSCFTKIAECEEQLEEEIIPESSSLWEKLGISLPQTNSAPQESKTETFCPKMAGKDFMSQRKEYREDLRKLSSDLADLKKEIVEEQEALSKKLKEIEDEVTEAQETLEENKADFAEKRREKLTEFSEQQRKTAEDQRVKEMELLKLEGELVNVNRKYVTELISLTEQASKRACLGAIRKMRDDVLKAEGQSNSVRLAKERRQNLIASYNDCMKTYDQKRTSLMESHKQENDRINKTIASLKGDLEDQENALKAAQAQLAEIEKEMTERTTQAEQRYLSLTRSAATRMQAANKSSQDKIAALNLKKAELEKDKNEVSNDITNMGQKPKNPRSTLRAEDILNEADVGIRELQSACENTECSKFFKAQCKELGSDKSGLLKEYERAKRNRSGTR